MKTILFAIALCGLTMNTAEAGSKAKAKATTHAKAKPKASAKAKPKAKSHRHAHVKPQARTVYRAARPGPPPRAHGSHVVYFHNGHWVRTHRSPLFMWKWNHIVGRWTVVIRF